MSRQPGNLYPKAFPIDSVVHAADMMWLHQDVSEDWFQVTGFVWGSLPGPGTRCWEPVGADYGGTSHASYLT